MNSDERSLTESAKRDPAAVAELYRQHYPTISRYVFRRVADQNEADDIVSNVFLSMVKHLHQYRYRGIPFRFWLYRLANTQLSRWARGRRNWAMQQLKDYDSQGSKPVTTHEPDAEMIDLVLATLPLRLQVVLSLHYLEGMKVAETAKVVNCSVGTVKSRLSEGRALMRERLTKRGFR